jgi:hypothetical protein
MFWLPLIKGIRCNFARLGMLKGDNYYNLSYFNL